MSNRRYSAKQLFQFRVIKDGKENRRRICEERIVSFLADSEIQALEEAKARGHESEDSYSIEDRQVFFEFVGILELIDLVDDEESGEVWWNLCEKVSPMERREKLIPPESELFVFKDLSIRKRGRLKL